MARLARLSSNGCGSTWAQTFSYDAFGNISKSGSISWQPNYSHAANQYLSGWNGASYDANGNLLNDTLNTYTWDVFGNLASANEKRSPTTRWAAWSNSMAPTNSCTRPMVTNSWRAWRASK